MMIEVVKTKVLPVIFSKVEAEQLVEDHILEVEKMPDASRGVKCVDMDFLLTSERVQSDTQLADYVGHVEDNARVHGGDDGAKDAVAATEYLDYGEEEERIVDDRQGRVSQNTPLVDFEFFPPLILHHIPQGPSI
jgi:hypothetical protein